MAAIAHSVLVSLLAFTLLAARADQSADVRRQVSYVASALTAGNPADAMTPFDKSFSGYEKLREYFSGLTNGYQLVNQLEVTDEQDSKDEATLTVEWTLTMTGEQTGYNNSRNATISVRVARKGGKWKIVEFAPLEFFNPQPKR